MAGISRGEVRQLTSRVPHLAAGGPRSPGVFGAKSCNLAISSHLTIQTFGESFFSKLIFKDFHQIFHQLEL